MKQSGILRINMFGGFSITAPYSGDMSIPGNVNDNDGHSKKLWGLLEYLIVNRSRTVAVGELYDLLWSGDSSEDPINALKILIYRARTELNRLGVYNGKELIINHRGVYQWNPDVPVDIDSEKFDKLYNLSRTQENEDERLHSMTQAIGLYRGHFLPKSVSYAWVRTADQLHHEHYLEICYEVAALLEARERYREIVSLMRGAVTIDPYVEQLHILLINALVKSGSQEDAFSHYKSTTEKFYRQFGRTPSDDLLAVYRNLTKTTSEFESDLGVIVEGMSEKADPEGAFYCELEVFREISQLKARECQRTGQSVHLGLVTMVHAPERRISQKIQVNEMDRLAEIIQNSLRIGDVYARYSLRQYILLLPNTSQENGDMVLSRIYKNYRASYPKSGVLLQCSLMPLEQRSVGTYSNTWLDEAGKQV